MKKNKNNALLVTLTQIDNIQELKDEQIFELAETISNNINLSGLRRGITNACMILSQVGEPKLGADTTYIAMDNQVRLELIYKLLNNHTNISAHVKNFRKDKLKCRENIEYLVTFIQNTVDTLNTVKEYQAFRVKEHKGNQKQLEEIQEDKKVETKKTTKALPEKKK